MENKILTTNFHTHTTRCNHAAGEDRQYVEEAIKGGLKVLGFSDHSPYFFLGDYYSTFRMKRAGAGICRFYFGAEEGI